MTNRDFLRHNVYRFRGNLTPYLRRPHSAVHFAGAERSSWPNQMEGAVESGTGTARRVLAELRRPRRGGANR